MANLLLVDDDAEGLECLAEVLRGNGYEVRTAHSAREGLEALRALPLPDALVLDVDMPMMDGVGMARMMKAHDDGEESVPIVLSSARRDLREVAKKVGTPYSLGKPVTVERLLDVVARAVREKIAPSLS